MLLNRFNFCVYGCVYVYVYACVPCVPCVYTTYAKHPINGTVKHILIMKKAFGIVSTVLLYTMLYNGRITLFNKFSVAILVEFIDPIRTVRA